VVQIDPGPTPTVAADDVDPGGGRVGLEPLDHLDDAAGVPVGGVDDEHVHPGVDERHRPLPGVAEEADGGADPQPARPVLGGQGVALGLGEVLDGEQAPELAAVVDDGELLDLVGGQQAQRLLLGDADRGGDQGRAGHHLVDRPGEVLLEPDVPVRDDADEDPVVVDHRQAGDAEPAAELVHLGERGVGADRHRVGDHAVLGALDPVDVLGLLLDRQVAVQHAQAALAGHRDGHPALGHGVHRRRQQRDPDLDVAGQPARGVGLGGDDVGLPRQEEHVVVGEAEHGEGLRDVGRGKGRGHVPIVGGPAAATGTGGPGARTAAGGPGSGLLEKNVGQGVSARPGVGT
jgi:hypothetical protein